jgi:hypothetical protein
MTRRGSIRSARRSSQAVMPAKFQDSPRRVERRVTVHPVLPATNLRRLRAMAACCASAW